MKNLEGRLLSEDELKDGGLIYQNNLFKDTKDMRVFYNKLLGVGLIGEKHNSKYKVLLQYEMEDKRK